MSGTLCALRMRPNFLTVVATATGAIPITFDPVFSGLAWSLIFGVAPRPERRQPAGPEA